MKKYLIGLAVIFAASLLPLGQANAQVALNPCNTAAVRTSAAFNLATATTTELVALVANQTVYVCDISMTISQVATTANTIKFVYGTGTACATGTANITGTFGIGGITAGIPIVVNTGGFKTIVSNALCATTTIGATGLFSGVVSYVQQ